jgi:hypothetical protein
VLGGIAFLGMQNLKEIRGPGYLSLALAIIVLIIGIARFPELKKHKKKFVSRLLIATIKKLMLDEPKIITIKKGGIHATQTIKIWCLSFVSNRTDRTTGTNYECS